MNSIEDVVEVISSFSTEQKTELLCKIIDYCCLDPHQIYPCLGLQEEAVERLAHRYASFLESEYFHREQLDYIPTRVIRKCVDKFFIENQ